MKVYLFELSREPLVLLGQLRNDGRLLPFSQFDIGGLLFQGPSETINVSLKLWNFGFIFAFNRIQLPAQNVLLLLQDLFTNNNNST